MNIGVVIPAREEPEIIKNTLDAITKQTLQAKQIIVVNDNSSDDAVEIMESFNVRVVNFPYDHPNWVMDKYLAKVSNLGLKELFDDLDYVTIVGSDEVLPYNHFDYISNKMMKEDITIASGKIINDERITIPRGSGRIVNWKWWKSLKSDKFNVSGLYPVNYGYETWLMGKCGASGRSFKVFPEIKSTVQRPTHANYTDGKYVKRGYAYKALGYNKRFVYLRAIALLIKNKKIRPSINMLSGFRSDDVELYELEVRDYYRNLQNKQTSVWRRN